MIKLKSLLKESVQKNVLYHATFYRLAEEIKIDGLVPGGNECRAFDWCDPNYVYLIDDAAEAIALVENSDNENIPEDWFGQIVCLAIDRSKLDISKLYKDVNYNPEPTEGDPTAGPPDDTHYHKSYMYKGVIPPSAIVDWDVKEPNESVNETMTYTDLMKHVDDGRKDRSRQVRSRSIPVTVDEGQESWNFRYKANPSTTGEPYQGKITFFKEIRKNQDAADLPCKVDCGCPDFMYRFAYNDAEEDAADIGNKTLNRCINRKPQPAYDFGVGMCKHLTALSRYLNTSIKNTKKSNLFEAMSEVAKTKNFVVTYND